MIPATNNRPLGQEEKHSLGSGEAPHYTFCIKYQIVILFAMGSVCTICVAIGESPSNPWQRCCSWDAERSMDDLVNLYGDRQLRSMHDVSAILREVCTGNKKSKARP